MPRRRRRPSLFGGLLWTVLGIVFLLGTLRVVPNVFEMVGRYWPIFLILLGLGKLLDYFLGKDTISLRFGEIFGIVVLVLLGWVVTKISSSRLMDIRIPITIGDRQIRPGDWLGTSYSFSEDASVPFPETLTLRVRNSYGSVRLDPGNDQQIRVRLRKVVYEDTESQAAEIAAEINLETLTEGSEVVIATNRDRLADRNYRFKTHMEITVPKRLRLFVQNAYGEIWAANLEGTIDLRTSHRSLEIRDCAAEIKTSNRYGETRLTNLTGSIEAVARGGRIQVEDVRGELKVRNEYDPVEIKDVDGPVTVSNRESSISLDRVTKLVVIDAPGSRVRAQNLSGGATLSTSHSGRVWISATTGDVHLHSRYSTIALNGIQGNVEIASSSDRITAERIGGGFKVIGTGSSVRADSISGPVDLATTIKDISVHNFEGSCVVSCEYSDVTLSLDKLGDGDIRVKSRNGDIDLYIPEDSAFEIEATARNGKAHSDFSGVVSEANAMDGDTLVGIVNQGGARIVLETEYSNIRLRSRGRRVADPSKRKPPGQRRHI